MQSTTYHNYTAIPSSDSDVESDTNDHFLLKEDKSSENALEWNREQFNESYTKIYDFIVSTMQSINWIIDILTLFALYDVNNIFYLLLSIAFIMSCLLITIYIEPQSNIRQLFPPFIFIQQLINIYSNEKKEKGIFKMKHKHLIFGYNGNNKYSWFQLWVQDRYNIHRLEIIHCIFQSFPHLILLYVLLLNNQQITCNNYIMIYVSFLCSLISIMVCSPIYFQILYYKLAHCCYFHDFTIDHYDISVFIFNIFAFLSDLICLLCVIAYYNDASFEGSVTKTLWCYQFTFIWIITVLSVIGLIYTMYEPFTSELRQDIRNFFECDKWINNYPEFAANRIVKNIGKILETISIVIFVLILLILIIIVDELIVFSWMAWLNISLFMRYQPPESGSWEKLIFWLKQYENKNDLIVRLCIINYHLLSNKHQYQVYKVYKPIENLMNQCVDYQDITFKDIRKHSNLKSDALTGLLHTYVVGMDYHWKTTTKWKKRWISALIFLYFCTRTILALIPIIGLIECFTNFTLIITLEWIYCILFLCTIGSTYGVFRHLYIFMHIMPGSFHLSSYSSLDDPLEHYLKVKKNIKYGKQEKINILKEYFMTDIINIIVKYLSPKSFRDCYEIELSNHSK